MIDIERFLIKSGYGVFFKAGDFTELEIKNLNNRTFSEIIQISKFHLLIQGYVDAFYPDKLGKSHLVARIYASDYQLGGLPDHFKREYDDFNDYILKFSKDAKLFSINSKKVEDLLEAPSFLKFVLQTNIIHLSKRVQEHYFRSVFNIEEYIAYILYHHSIDGSYIVENYFNFASLLKCDRSTLYKVLRSLEKEGAIIKNGKFIKIISFRKLKYIFEEKIFKIN